MANLHVIWTPGAAGIAHGYEGGPLVVNNTLYVMTPYPDYLMSYNLGTTHLNWTYRPGPSARAEGIACCDVVNRGGSWADGMIIYNTLDDYTVAVNAKTGKPVWKTKVGNMNLGETETMAPLVIPSKNMVIVGISGGELGVRGRVRGLDLHTGKIKWTAWSTGSDKDCRLGPGFKPYYKADQGANLGISTWPPNGWKHGGGTVWEFMTYDPTLNLFYYGTGNPGPWNPAQRRGANKWTATIFARNPTTGYAKWAWQVVPYSPQDFDQVGGFVLVNMKWHGQMRKLLIHTGKTGFVFVIDRTTGQLLSARPFQYVNWASGYNLQTGQPELVPGKVMRTGKKAMDICPTPQGAENEDPPAFSPQTGLLYIPTRNFCWNVKGIPVQFIAGTPYTGVTQVLFPGPGGPMGELVAWNVAEEKQAWDVPSRFGLSGGVLATAGKLVFYGTMSGWFRAVDASTGKVLWQTRLASGIVSNPITFIGPDGKQYIAVYCGIGGALGGPDFPSISANSPEAAGGMMNVMKGIKNTVRPGGLVYIFGL